MGTDWGVREWTEVYLKPSRVSEHKDTKPYRYVVAECGWPQGAFLADGHTVKHLAIVSNDWETDG